MKILGIDPGTATTGWGLLNVDPGLTGVEGNNGRTKLIVRKFGVINTDKNREMHNRLLTLKEGIGKLIKDYQPEIVVVEQIFFGVNSRTAIAIGQARGAIMLAVAEAQTPIFYQEYTGLTVKLMVAGHGRADKKQVQESVLKHLGLKELFVPKNQAGREVFRFRDDAYDALALAICHVLKTEGNKVTTP